MYHKGANTIQNNKAVFTRYQFLAQHVSRSLIAYKAQNKCGLYSYIATSMMQQTYVTYRMILDHWQIKYKQKVFSDFASQKQAYKIMMAGTENIYADVLSNPLLKLVSPKTSSSYIENLTIQSSIRQHIKMWNMTECLTPSLSSRSVQYFTSSCNNFGKLRNDKLLLLMKKLCFFRVIFLIILLSLYPEKSF